MMRVQGARAVGTAKYVPACPHVLTTVHDGGREGAGGSAATCARSTSLGVLRALVGVGAWYEVRLALGEGSCEVELVEVEGSAAGPASAWAAVPRSPPMLPCGKKLLHAG